MQWTFCKKRYADLNDLYQDKANIILEQQKIIDVVYSEHYDEFVASLKDAFNAAPSSVVVKDMEALVDALIKGYTLLERKFWQDLLRLGLGDNITRLIDDKPLERKY